MFFITYHTVRSSILDKSEAILKFYAATIIVLSAGFEFIINKYISVNLCFCIYALISFLRKNKKCMTYLTWNVKKKRKTFIYDETGKERRTVINTAWTCFQFKGALSGATRRGKRISRIVLLGGWMAVMVGVRRPRASTINVYKRRIETKEWGKVRSRRRQPQTYHGRSVVRGTWHALRLFVSLPWILLWITSPSSIRLYSAFLSLLHCLSPVSLLPYLILFLSFLPLLLRPFILSYFVFVFSPLFPPSFSLLTSLFLSPPFLLFERIQLDSTRSVLR